MDPAGSNPVFLLLLLCLLSASAYVEPPTKVQLDCHNMENILKWNYSEHRPGLRFKVSIRSVSSEPKEVWVNSPTLQANVSDLSDPSNDYYLEVTAVMGKNESAAAPPKGIVFSYFENSLAKQKCFLDLPPVKLTPLSVDFVQLSFKHPAMLYHRGSASSPESSEYDITYDEEELPEDPTEEILEEIPEDTTEDIPVFSYEVVIVNQTGVALDKHYFNCWDSVCKTKLPVDAKEQSHCVTIKGELKKMSVRGTQKYCTLPVETTNNNTLIYIIVGLSVVVVLVLLVVILYVFLKKLIDPSTSLPRAMTFTDRLKKQFTPTLAQEPVIIPQVEPQSPTPLLSPAEEKELIPADSSSTKSDARLRIGVSLEDEGVCHETGIGGDTEPGYTLQDEDDTLFCESSGYEKRTVLVDIGDNEQVEGYREVKGDV